MKSTSRSIRWPLGLLFLGSIAVPLASLAFQQQTAPGTPPAQPQAARGGRAMSPAQLAMQKATEEDHQAMMDQLHITSIRRGRDGNNKDSPYYANYDEAKANPYPVLPDPLKLNNGKKVTKASEWWSKRRPEIVEDFDREVYGRVPANVPAVKWEVIKITEDKVGDVPVITKQVQGTVDNSSDPQIEVKIALTVAVPANAKGPVPVVMQYGGFGFGPPPGGRMGLGGPGLPGAARAGAPPASQGAAGAAGRVGPPAGFGGRGPTGPSWQQQVLAKGWGYATLTPNSIQADNGAGLTSGIIGLCNKGQRRKPDDWGALRAWAWGASRAIDYFETDKAVDAKHIAIEGHSRYGKAALVAMAYEPRMWTAYVSSSGEGGAKLNRRDWGEIVENVAGSGEYHWMAGNFIKYAGPLNWNDLPVDSHELIAMCAPRPVFVSGGATNGDGWVDAKGMFMATAAASPVYELLGAKGLGTTVFPPIETALVDGDLAFRQHSSGHTDGPNWPFFLAFAERHMAIAKVPKLPKK
jgi:hypothetical protein